MSKLFSFLLVMMFVSCQETTFLSDDSLTVKDDSRNSCEGLEEGASEEVRFYSESTINFEESCEDYEVKVKKSCQNGKIGFYINGEEVFEENFSSSCEVSEPSDCEDLKHGESMERKMFRYSSVEFGSSCQVEIQKRSCSNGSLSDYSGNYENDSCVVLPPKNCGDVAHGSSEVRLMYNESSVAFGSKCEGEKQERVCKNGIFSNFSGTFKNEKCEVKGPASCGNLADGQSEYRLRFKSSIVDYDQKCISQKQSRTCSNGVLSSFSGDYKESSCKQSEPKSCDGIAHGELDKRVRYLSAEVSSDKLCESEVQTRVCDNGVFSKFSGKYEQESCEVVMRNCRELAHGDYIKREMFKSEQVSFDQKCESEVQYQKCDDGKLSDFSGNYKYEKCEPLKPMDCKGVSHGHSLVRVRFKEAKSKECVAEKQQAICSNGVLSEYDGEYKFEKCDEIADEPEACQPGKSLMVWVDKNSDGTKDTEPVEVIAFHGEESAKENYNYYSVSAHPIHGPQPEGYKAKAYFYEGSDGLSLQFVYSKDKIKGQPYDGSPNSQVEWSIETKGNDLVDKVMFSDDGKELKLKSQMGQSNFYYGKFHYWNNTDGGVIGPFVTEDFSIEIKPILERENASSNVKNDAFHDVSFYSKDGKKVTLDYTPGKDSIMIEYVGVKYCEEPIEKIGCSDGSREGFKNLGDFENIAACAGGFREKGVLPEHRERKCSEAGNDSTNPEGHGCSVQDVCAKGWEVLPSLSVLQEFTYGKYCHAMESDNLTENIAFVGGVTGEGWGRVYNDDEQLHAILNYKDYDARDYKKHVNDMFYCGGQKVAYTYGNHPYKKYFSSFSNNQCYGVQSFAKCQSKNGHLEAAEYIQDLVKKSESMYGGGVICVKSSAVDKLKIDERLRRVVKEEPQVSCENIIQNGSFEEGHNLNSRSWNTFKEVGAWMSDLSSSHAGIEIQCLGTGGFTSSDGDCHLELDAHHGKNGFKESDVAIYQYIELEKNESYNLKMDLYSRNKKFDSNKFYIELINEEGEQVYIGKDSPVESSWNEKFVGFTSPFEGKVKFMIRSVKDEDTMGANIDNIELLRKSCAEPTKLAPLSYK